MNCIDCKWAIQQDEKEQCKKASPEVRECEGYESIRMSREEYERQTELKKQVKEMLEDKE